MAESNDRVGEQLSYDPKALRERYLTERDKRLRHDGNEQYVHLEGEFGDFATDPFAASEFEREALNDEVDAVVIGGGIGGLLTASRLRQAGVDRIRVIDRAGDFGGVWYFNRYPDVRCDVDATIYLPLLEETGYIPTEKYIRGREIREYLQSVGRHFDLYSDACFQTEVLSIIWDDDCARWVIRTDRGDEMRAQFVCLATPSTPGCQPKLPRIPGIKDFRGRSFHTSRWDYEYTGGDECGGMDRLSDKRVAVIGTGASAIQCIPVLAEYAKELLVVQRTPAAVEPRNNRPTSPDWVRSLVPGWQERRMINFDAILLGMQVEEDLIDDGWTQAAALWAPGEEDAQNGSGNTSLTPSQRADFLLMEEIRDRVSRVVQDPDVADALKPYYNRLCKRPLYSDEYLQAFNRPNVKLVDTQGAGVRRITETGIDVGGELHEVDCIVYGSGFDVGLYCYQAGGYQVIGRDGIDMADRWREGMRSLHGMYTHKFPNLFIIGAQAQASITINFPHILRRQGEHAAAVIRHCMDEGIVTMEVTADAEHAWAQMLADKAVDRTEFEMECTPSYFNNEGRFDGRPSLFSSQYGGGPFEYVELCKDWLAAGFDTDVQLERRASGEDAT